MDEKAAKRQQRWRSKKAQEGLTQVRLWVPAERASDLAAIAAAWRASRPGGEPTAKQLYEVEKALKAKPNLKPPFAEIMADRYRLEVWLAIYGLSARYKDQSKVKRQQQRTANAKQTRRKMMKDTNKHQFDRLHIWAR